MTDLPSMTTAEFARLAERTLRRWPEGDVVKNQVGNLNVYVGDEWVAWLDLRTGEVRSTLDFRGEQMTRPTDEEPGEGAAPWT